VPDLAPLAPSIGLSVQHLGEKGGDGSADGRSGGGEKRGLRLGQVRPQHRAIIASFGFFCQECLEFGAQLTRFVRPACLLPVQCLVV
jgi:hypothetical protein